MELIAFKIPDKLVHQIDKLVRAGRFSSRSEAIRYAIRSFLKTHEEPSQKK